MKISKTGIIELVKEQFTLLDGCKLKDELRVVMTKIYFDRDENRLVSTDGRRLVYIDVKSDEKNLDCLTSDYYNAVKMGKEFKLIPDHDFTVDYLNYKRVLPDISKYTESQYSFHISTNSTSSSSSLFSLAIVSGKAFNTDYMKVLKNVAVQSVHYDDKENTPLVFTLNYGVYIVMPIKLEDIKKSRMEKTA